MKKRIQFVDLAKRVCITLVVFAHCGCPLPLLGLEAVRMPLYFMLSGLFFKDYGGFFQLLVRKLNKLLIPFLFFYLTAYAVYYLFEWAKPGLIVTPANGILDVFTQRQMFNGPIWFLLCLFWGNLFFCIIKQNLRQEYQRAVAVLLLAGVGVTLGYNGVFVACLIDVSLTSLPFFYMGYLLNRTPILYPNKFDRYSVLIAICFWIVSVIAHFTVGTPHISFLQNIINGNVLLAYIIPLIQVLAILFICKAVGHVPFLSYIGRYSIVLLVLHHMIYRPLALVIRHFDLPQPALLNALITILVCAALIEPCRRLIPWFVAQKDLVKISVDRESKAENKK